MYANGPHKYNQRQIHLRAEYYGKYMYYACHEGLSGRNLKLRIAQDMRATN